MIRVGIIGASGYTGAELLRLCGAHPQFEVVCVTADSTAGEPVGSLYPHLATAYSEMVFAPTTPETIAECARADLVFCALPHGASQALMPTLAAGTAVIVDLAADFRLSDTSAYEHWYGEPHQAPDLVGEFVYGLPEITGAQLVGARLVAAAGCYPTAASLALAPLLEHGLVEPGMLLVDAASGVSGAGRPPKPSTTFGAVDSNFTAYGLLDHRHTPEMEQTLSMVGRQPHDDVSVLFTPHLAPMSRGILATCYARPGPQAASGALPGAEELHDLYVTRYAAHPFVTVIDTPPATKSTLGANTAHIMVTSDPRTGWILAMCSIDNLVKGAAGQAIQCANIAMGLEETSGLPMVGVYP